MNKHYIYCSQKTSDKAVMINNLQLELKKKIAFDFNKDEILLENNRK